MTLETADRPKAREGRQTVAPADHAYFGLVVPAEFVARTMIERRATQPVGPPFVSGGEYDF